MSHRNFNHRLVRLCAVAIVTLLISQQNMSAAPNAADEQPAASEKPATKKDKAKKRTAKKPVVDNEQRPPMPAHFAKVVNDEQREKIIAILQEFAPQIEQKRAELKALTDQREAALFKVLTPQQRRQVEELRAQSQANRAAASADGVDDSAAGQAKASKPAKSGE
jgi:hypothetical protein